MSTLKPQLINDPVIGGLLRNTIDVVGVVDPRLIEQIVPVFDISRFLGKSAVRQATIAVTGNGDHTDSNLTVGTGKIWFLYGITAEQLTGTFDVDALQITAGAYTGDVYRFTAGAFASVQYGS